jgi:hypothetical protein
MASKWHCSLLAICGLGLAVPAFAQIDGARFASDLRTKYGPPLARETFIARQDIEMIVDYAANGSVCKIQLPPVAQVPESNVKTPKAVDDFLAELVPLTIRGKVLQRLHEATGLPSVSIVEYENVTISGMFQGQRRTGVTVTFKNEECQEQSAR